MKTCSKCRTPKEDICFGKSRDRPDGLYSQCKACKSPPKPKKESRKGWVQDDIGYIPLTQGKIALVDPQNVYWLSQWNWNARWCPSTKSFYASRQAKKGDHQKTVNMHREVMQEDNPKVQIDHEDHNTLDNRSENLRRASNAQNCQNARRRKDNSSGFKGVTFNTYWGRFNARLQVDKKRLFLGWFDSAEEAYAAYVRAAAEHHKEFANVA